MADDSQAETRGERGEWDDELRTIGFRLREIQRLMGIRVEQENRRLEQEGVEPVTRPRFRDPEELAADDD